MLEAVKRPKIRDVVAARLKAYILSEGLQSGDRLPTENALAASFGVSRLSLREATKALEFLGIVESKPGRGLIVGQVNMERVTEYIGFQPAIMAAPLQQLIDSRVVIEVGVLPYAVARMRENPAIYAELNSINDELRRTRTLKKWVKLDIAFHRRLVEAGGLSPLLAVNDLLEVFFMQFRESVKKAQWHRGIESHQRLIDWLRDGALEPATDELRRHIESHKPFLKSQP